MEKKNKEKLNLTVTPEIKDYLVKQSYAFGMSVSAYITMLVSSTRNQTQNILDMSEIKEMLKKIEENSLSKK